jgi:hypothetical protein
VDCGWYKNYFNNEKDMRMEKKAVNRIVKNIMLSLIIYALPIVLMLLSFYLTGERPWQKAASTNSEQPFNRILGR